MIQAEAGVDHRRGEVQGEERDRGRQQQRRRLRRRPEDGLGRQGVG